MCVYSLDVKFTGNDYTYNTTRLSNASVYSYVLMNGY